MKYYLFLFLFCAMIAMLSGDSGGPDEFGYRWIDSNEPGGPAFNWIEISSTGTMLSALDCDDCYTSVTFSRPFEFYGIEYSMVYVTSNGYASFESSTYFPISATYSGFPDSGTPNAVIAAYNFDQDPGDSPGHVYYQDFGDYIVIEWFDVCEYPGSGSYSPSTWEIILNYTRKEIVFQYLHTEALGSHTPQIGIENETGTIGLDFYDWSSSMDPPDSLTVRMRATPIASAPYYDDFETESGDFSLGDLSGWERGMLYGSSPAFPPHSGSNCYVTNLTDDYDNNADWTLQAPNIDASNNDWPILDFWHFYQTEESHDGGVVEVSTDDGESWFIIEPEEGYPTAMTAGPLAGSEAFSGSSGGWIYSSFDLSDYSDMEILMRYRFVSDGSTVDAGWFVDDFGFHQAFGVLHGNVDLAYFDPDSGALVEIPDLGIMAITDNDGYFCFDTIAAGAHYIRLSRDHFVTRDSIHFTVERFDTTYLNLLLAPELYNEDFETSDGDMVPDPVGGWVWGTPTAGPENAHSGVYCWGTNLEGNYENDVHWKLTLQIPIYEVHWPLLQFYTWYTFEEGFFGTLPDGGNLKVSVDSGYTWTVIEPVYGYDGIVGEHNDHIGGEPAFGDDENGDFWREVFFPLYEFAGNPVVWIRFDLGSDSHNRSKGWYIDDVRIADDSTYADIKESARLPQKTYIVAAPNPFNSTCRINYFIENDGVIEIFDIAGRTIETRNVQHGAGTLVWSPENIPSGLYLARISDGKESRLIRISLIR